MQYAPTLTDQKLDSFLSIELQTRYVWGCMQYAPTLTDQKLDSFLSIELQTRYVLGRMPYAPTLTDQKIDSLLSIESKTRYVWGCRSLWSIHSRQGTLKICMNASKTRRGFDEYGHIYAKPAEDGTNMAIFTQNPPGMGQIWPYSRKTRRGFDEYGHIRVKPAEDLTNMAIFAQNPPRMGRIWPYLRKTRRGWDEYAHSHRILAGVRIKYVSSFVLFGEDRNVYAKISLKLGKDRKVGG